jgi:hypothetical protein
MKVIGTIVGLITAFVLAITALYSLLFMIGLLICCFIDAFNNYKFGPPSANFAVLIGFLAVLSITSLVLTPLWLEELKNVNKNRGM